MLLAAAESIRIAEMTAAGMKSGKIQKLHVKRKRGIFKCDQCTSVFGLRHNLLRHKRTIHEGKRPFKCTATGCKATFVQRFDLQTHAASVHDKRKDFACGLCERQFAQRSNLLTHLRGAHQDAPGDTIERLVNECEVSSSSCSTAGSVVSSAGGECKDSGSGKVQEDCSGQVVQSARKQAAHSYHNQCPSSILSSPLYQLASLQCDESLDDVPVAQLPRTSCLKSSSPNVKL